jgi:guanine deaminase
MNYGISDSFVLHGDICYSKTPKTLSCVEDGYLVCENGVSQGVYDSLPEKYEDLPLLDHENKLILPGLVDLHMHAPQFAFRGLGMDFELLEWLETYTFPEESKYRNLGYARNAYTAVVRNLVNGPNTRSCLYATVHLPATRLLMDMLEDSGLVCMVGKVNMDRNCPAYLCETNAARSAEDTRRWLNASIGRYKNTSTILTPRFIPVCSDELMHELAEIQQEFKIPVQSHLSESLAEIEWVRQLCPSSKSYSDAYDSFGLFGGGAPTIMAHCVWSDDSEIELMRRNNVFVAHCPQSNMNLTSGIAPVRRFLNNDLSTGLGSDVAGGCHTSIFRAMSDAIQVSKLRFRHVNQEESPITVAEAFYLGTAGGGAFFGKAGSFEPGYEFDAIVMDDSGIYAPFPLTIEERLARVIYFSDDRHVHEKYVRGRCVKYRV